MAGRTLRQDRMTSVDNAGTPNMPQVLLTYGYDAVGNVLSVVEPGIGGTTNARVDSVYDGRDLLVQRGWQGVGMSPIGVVFGYNVAGERTLVGRLANLDEGRRVGRTTFEYDLLGRLDRLTHRDALDAVIADYDYGYNLASELISESRLGVNRTYGYDLAGQLTSADHPNGDVSIFSGVLPSGQPDESYSYDLNGNRTINGYVIGPGNQLLEDPTWEYEYDLEGNLLKKTQKTTGDVWWYSYDHRNRMVGATLRNSASVVLDDVRFTYDVFDKRIEKKVDTDGDGDWDQATKTIYDGDHAWADYDMEGDLVARYLFGDEIDEIIARYRVGQGTAWYLTDKLGTVRDLADVNGQRLAHYEYDSFGNIIRITNAAGVVDSTFADRFTYTGREFDIETGLYYYRARYYDAATGRFLSEDPLGCSCGDKNLYRYVHNSPLNATDPTGMLAKTPVKRPVKRGAGPEYGLMLFISVGLLAPPAWATFKVVVNTASVH